MGDHPTSPAVASIESDLRRRVLAAVDRVQAICLWEAERIELVACDLAERFREANGAWAETKQAVRPRLLYSRSPRSSRCSTVLVCHQRCAQSTRSEQLMSQPLIAKRAWDPCSGGDDCSRLYCVVRRFLVSSNVYSSVLVVDGFACAEPAHPCAQCEKTRR